MGRWVLIAALGLSGCGLVGYDLSALSSSDSGPVDGDGSPIDVDGSTATVPTGECFGAVTGTYVGNGEPEREIGLEFQPVLVIVHSAAGRAPMLRMVTMPPNQSKQAIGGSPLETNVLSEAVDGFLVGADVRVNNSGETYFWVAFPAAGTATGQYGGNGASQSISGLEMTPEWILIADEGDGVVVTRFDNALDRTYRLEGLDGVTGGVTSLDSDGFSLAGRPYSNADGRTFHYVAWRSEVGRILASGYTGDGTVSRLIEPGFRPDYLMIRNQSQERAFHRFAPQLGDVSLPFDSGVPIIDAIESLEDSGFQIGPDPAVNESGTEVSYLSFASCAGG